MDDRQARTVIEAYRDATASPVEVRRANWDAIEARIANPGSRVDGDAATSGAGRTSAGRWAIVGAVAAAAALVAWIARDGSLGAEATRSDARDQASDRAQPGDRSLTTEPRTTDVARPANDAAPAELVASPPHAVQPPPAPSKAAPAPATTTPSRPSASTPAIAPSSAPPVDPMLAEAALLQDARAALAAGDEAGALALLEQHRARFPEAVLAEERWILAVRAHCKAGDGKAAGAASDFLRAHPRSRAATALVAAPCP